LPEVEQRVILDEALKLARTIQPNRDRAYIVSLIAKELSGPEQNEVLSTAIASLVSWVREREEYEYWPRTMEIIAPLISEALVPEVLAAAQSLKGEERAYFIAVLADGLQHNQKITAMAEALALVRESRNTSGFGMMAFAEIAKRLNDPERTEVLAESITAFKSDPFNYSIVPICKVADLLSDTLLAEVLKISVAIRDSHLLAMALAIVASLFLDSDRDETLNQAIGFARGGEGNSSLATGLYNIAELVPECERLDIIKEAFNAARLINNLNQVNFLIEIALLFPESDRLKLADEVNFKINAVQDDASRASYLARFARMVSEGQRHAMIEEALALAKSVKNQSRKASILLQIGKEVPENARAGLYAEALAAANASEEQALIAAAKAMQESGLAEAIRYVEGIEDDFGVGYALYLIAFGCPEEERAAIVPILAKKVKDESWRAFLLGALFEKLKDADIATAVDAIEGIREDEARATAMCGLMRRKSGLVRHDTVRSFLRVADTLARDNFLRAFPQVATTIFRTEGRNGLVETRRAICDAGRWFP
jgi:hypothetical protein